MLSLGVSQKPVVMPHYPHMLSEDIDVWTEYLKAPIVTIKELWYDVHVGGAVIPLAGASAMERRVSAGVSRKRIDVICKVGGGYWVVEVKPMGSMLALGQVISYTRMFRAEFIPDGAVWPVVVCYHADPDLIDDFEGAGVGLIEV